MGNLIKMSLKLLFRNVGFWFFMVTMPILSVYILNLNVNADLAYFRDDIVREIQELDGIDQKVAYYGKSGEFLIKVYDASGSELSELFLNNLAQSGLFTVCRVKAPGLTRADVDGRMEFEGFEDRMGAAVYLDRSFDEAVCTGDVADAMTVYLLSEDERFDLFERELKGFIQEVRGIVQLSGKQGDDAAAEVRKLHETDPAKEVHALAKKGAAALTRKQVNQKAQMGYAFSFLTLCFVFCGVIVAHTAIEEDKHKVLTRIRLTGTGNVTYFASKFVVAVIISMMITVVLGGLTLFLGEEDLGMSRLSFLLMVFLMGVIFNTLSLLLGILSGDVMSANFIAFTLWTLSSLLAGLYFPLDDASKLVKTMSYVMPQRWFMDSLDQIFMGDKAGYLMVLCITMAYLIIVLSFGSVGLKMKKLEQ